MAEEGMGVQYAPQTKEQDKGADLTVNEGAAPRRLPDLNFFHTQCEL